MDNGYKNMYKMKPGDVFVHAPNNSRREVYALIEGEYDNRNWIIIQFPYNGNIVRDKIGKGTQLHLGLQAGIDDSILQLMVERCFGDGRFSDFVR